MKRFVLALVAFAVCSPTQAYRVRFDMTQPMDNVFAYYSIGGAWSLFPIPVGSVPMGISTYELGNATLDSWALLGTIGSDGVVSGINNSINPPDGLPFSIVFPGFSLPPVRTDLVNLYVGGAFFVPEAFRLENFALVNEEVLKSDTATANLAVYSYDNATRIGTASFQPDATIEVLVPNSQTVSLGKVTAGNLASLAADDGNAETICKFLIPNLGSPFIRFTCSFTTTKPVPSNLELSLKAKTSTAGAFKVRGFLHNFVAGTDVLLIPDTTINLSYVNYSGSAPGVLAEYLSNKNALAKVEVQQSGPAAVLLPCAVFEAVNLKVTG